MRTEFGSFFFFFLFFITSLWKLSLNWTIVQQSYIIENLVCSNRWSILHPCYTHLAMMCAAMFPLLRIGLSSTSWTRPKNSGPFNLVLDCLHFLSAKSAFSNHFSVLHVCQDTFIQLFKKCCFLKCEENALS